MTTQGPGPGTAVAPLERHVEKRPAKDPLVTPTPTRPERTGSSDRVVRPLAVGRLVDERFRLVRSLGAGGMAQVMLARDVALDREVALKFLGPTLLTDPVWRDRFVVEARNMARVRHVNVVQIHSFGMHEGWPYFVMEYVPGGTLAEWIHRHQHPPVADVVALIRQVAAGIDAIHAAGLVHHDVKPTNVLVGDDGRVAIADLGLARLISGLGGRQGTSGTPRYMAPEQFTIRPFPPEHLLRTDIYQLGVTAFEMLVGRAPFDGPDPLTVFRKHRSEPPPLPSSWRKDLGHEVDLAILTALAKDPARRHPSATAFCDALGAAAPALNARRTDFATALPLRVLVADDDPAQLAATSAVLRGGLPTGSEVDAVADGAEAMLAAGARRYDVLVLDLRMPGMSGLEVAAAIRAESRRRVVLVTADGGADEWRALRALGGEAMLLKPFDTEQLVDTVRRVALRSSAR